MGLLYGRRALNFPFRRFLARAVAEITERYAGQWTFEGGQNMDLGGVQVERTWMATPPTGHACDAGADAGDGLASSITHHPSPITHHSPFLSPPLTPAPLPQARAAAASSRCAAPATARAPPRPASRATRCRSTRPPASSSARSARSRTSWTSLRRPSPCSRPPPRTRTTSRS